MDESHFYELLVVDSFISEMIKSKRSPAGGASYLDA